MSNTADHPPPYAYVSRVTTQSLRSVVLPFAAFGAIWALASSISLFQDLSTDRAQHQKKLATFTIVLGSLDLCITVMLLFGVVAAVTKRLALIRIFSFMSAVVTVIVIATGLLRTIVHFMLKDALISECTALATGHDMVSLWGVWYSHPGDNLTPGEAAQFCQKAWSHDSFSEIFWLISEIILLPLFTAVAFSYAQQESALASRGTAARLPTSYAPAYAAGPGYAAANESVLALPEVAYDPSYAPPPGSPPPFDKTLPAYGGEEMEKGFDPMKTPAAEDPFADYEEHPRY